MTTLRRLGVLLVLAGTAAALPAAAQPPAPCGVVPVTISVVNGDVKVSRDPVPVRVNCDTIEWSYADGQALIGMKKNGNPFPDKFKHADKKVKTGKANKVGKFPYWIAIPLPDGTALYLDPDVDVQP
jgi:hypothetical protein